MQIKVAKSIYFVFFNRKIWAYQKKVVILQAFCRGQRNLVITRSRDREKANYY